MARSLKATLALMVLLGVTAAPSPAQEVVAQGPWEAIDYAVSGQWQIVRRDARHYVRLDDEFDTRNGPDLHIVLSRQRLDRITNDNATEQALIVGRLHTKDDSLFFKRMRGAQELPLPPGTNPSSYRTILIHCVKHPPTGARGAVRRYEIGRAHV